MDAQRIVGRFGGWLLWCTLGSMFALGPGTALAQAGTTLDACGQSFTAGLGPGYLCQNQAQAPVPNNASQSQGWAYYCDDTNGVYTNFWSGDGGIAWFNSCFTEAENPILESGNEADANFTNWCTESERITVVLACWNLPQPSD